MLQNKTIRVGLLALLLLGAVVGGRALADDKNPGQDDLDRATAAKVSATTVSDLAEVIRLCESALTKGLDEANTDFAKSLLASTLVHRAAVAEKVVFHVLTTDPRWPRYRRLALDDLEKAVKLIADQPEALFLIARLNLLPGGDRKRALEALDQSIRLGTDNIPLRLKALLLRSGVHEDAAKQLADLDEAVRIAPHNAGAVRARGLAHAQRDKPEAALADFQTALELEPDHAPTQEAKAMVLAALKRYDEALAALEKARELAPGLVSPLTLRAQIHVAQGDVKAALADLDEALVLQSRNVIVLLLRATVHDELGDPERAMADVDKAIEIRPDFVRARRLRAILLAKADKMDEGIAELQKVLKDAPDDLPTRLQLAMLHAAAHQSRKAIDIYSEILAKQPEEVEALHGRADARLGLGKHAAAIADFNKALKLKPDDSGILNNLAWVLATSPDKELRDGKRAVKLAAKACELTDYKRAHILSTLAAAHAEAGDFPSAVKWSKKALDAVEDETEEDLEKPLAKELESYQAGKPWRERLQEDEPIEPEP